MRGADDIRGGGDFSRPLSLQGEGSGEGVRAGISAASEGAATPHSRGIRAARHLRKNQTSAERVLWKHLRKGQLGGLHFRRQHPIGPYIADFCCIPKRLVVEIDGYFHEDPERAARDQTRTVWLRAAGYRVVRFKDSDPLAHVLAAIAQAAGVGSQLDGRRGPPPPAPPPEGRGGT